ncbi:MAG: radical SAM protein [Desulfuromonadales bacterium]
MNRLAIVLVHGFSGDPADLAPLIGRLGEAFGGETLCPIVLPEHPPVDALSFVERRLTAGIAERLHALQQEQREIVVIGHSTGGNLLLRALDETGIAPALVILAATPFAVGAEGLERWQRHRQGRDNLTLTSLATLGALINATGAKGPARPWPLLLLADSADQLVPDDELAGWLNRFSASRRMVTVAGAGHQLFAGNHGKDAVEAVVARIADLVAERAATALCAVETEARGFVANNPTFPGHLAHTSSGRRLLGLPARFPERAAGDPIFANIEITRRCSLACRHCARTLTGVRGDDMSLATFQRLLAMLPNAYRITLVGLGEPLLHPQVVEFVALAAAQGRRLALVTNAMALDEALATRLLAAGLDSIAFSLDAAEPELLGQLRPGSDLTGITANIRRFAALARQLDRPVSLAVFAAISRQGLPGLPEMVRLVGTLGVQVLMLSDLNFAENQAASLAAAPEDEVASTVRSAIAAAFNNGLPVLTVRALEEFGLARRYRDALLLPVDQLYRRSPRHRFCHSPWQTLAINVRGEVALCDCQPERMVGNLLEQPLAELWNSPAFCTQRRQMRSDSPPAACRICPRF